MNQKDIVYIDIEDEITGIIDKVRSSGQNLVALVLPKRATVLQSSVNMKLLKRAADQAKKQLVLITNEANLLPLAGSIKLPVAKDLQSKPEIPPVQIPKDTDMDELLKVDQAEEPNLDLKKAGNKPVGELASLPSERGQPAKPELTPMPIPRPQDKQDKAEESIELDNTDKKDEDKASHKKGEKESKDKKLKVPNFRRFRLKLILAVLLLIVLIVGWILANNILPKAKVIIGTNTSNINVSLNLNLDTTAKSVSTSQNIVPAVLQSSQKTQSQQVATTGQKNEGNAASGSVTMAATECAPNLISPPDVPSGTAVSINNLTFITQSNTSFNFVKPKVNCNYYQASSPTTVVAQQPGSQYNVAANSTFTVSGRSDVTASNSNAFTGGSDNNIQVVAQADINNATSKIQAPDTSTIKAALQNSLQQAGLYPITSTFSAGNPSNTSSASVGQQATSVTVTQAITYTMMGIHQSDLQTLVDNNINQQIDTSKQSIQNDGLSQITFNVANQSSTGAQITAQTTGLAGPHINVANLKRQIEGKKTGDIQTIINAYPGVTSVTVHYSPFWVSSPPKNVNKITIEFKKST